MSEGTLSRRGLLKTAQLLPLAGLLPAAAAAETKAADTKGGNSVSVTPFKVDVPQKRLDHVLNRIRDAEWPDVPEAADPWHFGCSQPAMKDLVSYLLTKYDWRARAAEMNTFPHFKARVDD